MNVSEWATRKESILSPPIGGSTRERCRSPRERWGDLFSSAISKRHALMRA